MKIIRIELQNINSLKTESPIVIDFESEKFKDVGLFAITGHTGAGKTTILDAITIALYHQVPRFNKTNIKAGLKDVISYGASHALARVTFDNKGIRYEAHWSMRIATGSGRILTNPVEEVRLKNLSSGKIIAEKKLDVKSSIENITQLNYNQFLRSVMLAQGEFAAFVSAKATDKGRLLEQITGEYIYKKIGYTILQKKYDEQKILDTINSEINSNDLLSNEQYQLLRTEKLTISDNIIKLDSELQNYEQIINWNKKQIELNDQIKKIKIEQTEHHTYKENNKHSLELLKQYEKAEPFKNILTEISRLENENRIQNDTYNKIEEKLKLISANITNDECILSKKQNIHQQLDTNFKEWIPKLEKVSILDTEIKALNETKVSINKHTEQLSSLYDNLNNNYNSKITEKKNSEELQLDINNYLKQHELVPQIEDKFNNWKIELALLKEASTKINSELELITKIKNQTNLLNLELEEKNRITSADKKTVDNLSTELELLSQKINSINLYKTIDERDSINKEITKWEKLKLLSDNYIKQTSTKENLELDKAQQLKNKESSESKIKQYKTDIEKAQSSINDALKIIELEKKVKSFEDERKQLKAEKPCPLCGSTDHPYVKVYKKVEISKLELDLSDRQLLLDKLIKQKNTDEILLNTASTKLIEIIKQLQTTIDEINKTEQTAKSLSLNCNINDKETIDNNINNLTVKLEEIKNKISYVEDIQNKKQTIEQEFEAKNKKLNSLTTEIIKLQENITNKQNLLTESEQELIKSKNNYQTKRNGLSSSISQFNLKIPLNNQDDNIFIAHIDKLINNYNAADKRLLKEEQNSSELKIAITNLEQQIKEKHIEVKKLKNEYNDTEYKLNELTKSRINILPIEITTETKRTELETKLNKAKNELEIATKNLQDLKTDKSNKLTQKADINSTIKKLNIELNTNNDELNIKLKQSDFETQSEIKTALLDSPTLTNITKLKKTIDNEELRLITLEQKLVKDITQHNAIKSFDMSIENTLDKFKKLKLTKDQNLKRVGEINQRFNIDKQIKQRNKNVYNRILAQEKVVKKWTDLLILLGGSKDAFNIYVQRLTLKNLIQMANIHLHKLNARYSLMMNKKYTKGEELNFMLVDHFQTDDTRLVDTCSGGEKFLISLALALGLSDLASKNVNIDSLFIDEGFGSLDNSTLETVISTLETLQAQGKIIGVISHVENMKERITTQIKVIKKVTELA